MQYAIPTKAAPGTWETWAVVPWGEIEDPAHDLVDLFSRTLVTESADRRIRDDVDCKRENTLAFIRAANAAADAPLRALLAQAQDPWR
jgi:hypothetical protein